MECMENTKSDAVRDERLKYLLRKANALPYFSGVYLMKNAAGRIIYVGKAKHLNNRVSSYFARIGGHDIKTAKLVDSITDFDYIITGSDMEAIVLENKLIKLHQPKYNIRLKSGHGYPYIKINPKEPYPRFIKTSERTADDALYFGPYTSGSSISRTLEEITRLYLLPECSRVFPRDIGKYRPCINHNIGKCMGLCSGNISFEVYREQIDAALMFLRGEYNSIIKEYNEKMVLAAEEQNYETAAVYRDKINALKILRQKQKIIGAPDVNQDIFSVCADELCSVIVVLSVRYGVLREKQSFNFAADKIVDTSALGQFIQDYYISRGNIPKQILTAGDVVLTAEDIAFITELASDQGVKVSVISPGKGGDRHICGLAVKNAKEAHIEYKNKYARDTGALTKLASMLRLEALPERIEAFDVSNQGDDSITCGMIVYAEGKYMRKDYKLFNMKTVIAADDYAAMSEAVRRRFNRYIENADAPSAAGFTVLPDLILVDGGKGHVGVIRSVLEEMSISVPVFGMVKDEFHKTRMLTDGEDEINIARDQSVFMLIYKIQEEVHRFTLNAMKARRTKSVTTSELEKLKGIGERKIKILYAAFGDINGIKRASEAELAAVKGITKTDAKALSEYFENKQGDKST